VRIEREKQQQVENCNVRYACARTSC
jgi:hypothetical protein